jgi:CubicO group peptidase (beta-lactamase class C family)
MNMICRGFLAAVLLMGASGARAQQGELDTYLETVRQQHALPALAAAVVRQGAVVAAGAVGVRALGTDVPVTIDDRFHLGSDTKAMTATLAGMMVEEGKLRWDSTIGEILGGKVQGMNPALAAVTLEQLLSHTSGIPTDNEEIANIYFNVDAFDFNTDDLRVKALEAWKTNQPEAPPGAPFQYSNLGYMIAGAMIETAAGQPWEELIYERVFEPLGLATAGLGPQATFGKLDAPVGHRMADDVPTATAPVGGSSSVTPMPWGAAADAPPVLGPAGIAHMSILDFAKWAGWNAGEGKRGPALVKPETLKRIHQQHVEIAIENPPPGTPTTGGYAMGWGLAGMSWADAPLLTHNGSNGMNLAKVTLDTANDFGVVAATNIGGPGADAALNQVTEHLFREYSGSAQ